jgi:3-oxoacyl-[acyl-carrier-protein] synthase III
MIGARILGTSHLLPGRRVSTAEVVERCLPGKDPSRLINATGIHHRHWAEPGTTAAELAEAAVRSALEAAGLLPEDLEQLIFVASMAGDWLGTATASLVIHRLGLDGKVGGFDLMNACVGLLSGMDLAARAVATGSGPVAVVSVEMVTRYLDLRCPRPYGLFGDAAAAVILGAGGPGFAATHFASDWGGGPTVGIPYPFGAEPLDFRTTSGQMTEMAVGALVDCTRKVLRKAGCSLREIDRFVLHQPNGPLLQAFLNALELPESAVDRFVHEVGSVAASAIGIGLDRLWRRGVRPGERVLMASVGSPMASGAMVYVA